MLYIVNAANTLKIGSTSFPLERMGGLQNYCPLPITLEFATRVPHDETLFECTLHSFLDKYRIHGEWFTINVSTAIDAVRTVARDLQLETVELSREEIANINQQLQFRRDSKPRANRTRGFPKTYFEFFRIFEEPQISGFNFHDVFFFAALLRRHCFTYLRARPLTRSRMLGVVGTRYSTWMRPIRAGRLVARANGGRLPNELARVRVKRIAQIVPPLPGNRKPGRAANANRAIEGSEP